MKETLLEAVAVTKVYPGAKEAVLSGANLRIDRAISRSSWGRPARGSPRCSTA